jgi:outer membrane receptor protein involved in Fe transport
VKRDRRPILLLLFCTPALAAADPTDATRAAPQELPDVVVIGTSPVPGTGIPADLYPGNAQSLSSRTMAPGTPALSAALGQDIGSVNLSDTQGNTFQMDVNFRGYTASPVLGTPQGLSVYVDGVRVNEPFGDIVSWDLIPQIAIANVTVVPGTNPVFGLNTLGGALDVNTKSGFAYPGTEVSIGAGSFGRRTLDAQYGGHGENTDTYIASSVFDERGWAQYNPSRARQVFAKTGYQDRLTDLDFSVQYVDDLLAGNQLVAQSALADAARGYSHPDTTATRHVAANLAGTRQFDAQASVEGNVFYRNIGRRILNSNINDPVPSGVPDQLSACAALYGGPCAGNVLSDTREDIAGLALQYSNQTSVLGHKQYFSAGYNGETANTHFTQFAQDGIVDTGGGVVGVDGFAPQSDIHAHNESQGLYATETLQVRPHASLTLSTRFDRSRIALSGNSVDSGGNPVRVDGDHGYQRMNPAIGGTLVLTPQATAFANYAQGFRTPSAIELACADPAHPCAGVPNAFSADPALQGIRAHSMEAGARGRLSAVQGAGVAGDRQLDWRMAVFASRLENDIIFNQSTLTTGYFSNVGRTQRDGVEAALDGTFAPLHLVLSASLLDATYQSAFTVANSANAGSGCPGSSCVPVRPGDRIPGIPREIVKLQLGYTVSERTRLDADMAAQGPSYARGDENNLATHGRIPGFATVQAGFSHQLSKSFELYGKVANAFNRRTANFGMLSNNNLKGGIAENFWAVGPPRTFYLGIKALL